MASSNLFPKFTATMSSFSGELQVRATATTPSGNGGTTGIIYTTTTEIVILDGTNTMHLVLPTCIQTLTPDKNGCLPPGTCNASWDYYPTFGAALVFAALFGILVFGHIWQAGK